VIRILHTADWHIGQTLRGFSREHEHRKVFGRLEEIIVERNVDALIIAGDVFDSQNPSGEAQQLFYDTLVRLSRARPKMTTVIVSGNRDAAGRLEAPRALLEAFKIRVVGNVRRHDGQIEASRHLVPIVDASGALAAHVLAVSSRKRSRCASRRQTTVVGRGQLSVNS
jgi:DNA repair protein SbcD/Mre11